MEDQEYAGFWIRLGAVLIDTVIFCIILAVPLTMIYGSGYWLSDQFIQGFWDILLTYIFPFIVTIWFWLKYMGTPGKMALRLQVVDARTGHKLTLSQSVARYIGYILSALPLFLGYIWVGIDERKQGWHDKIAGTVVIRNKQKREVRFE